MSIENQIEAYHDAQAEWEHLHRRAKEAVDYADLMGIYAVPFGRVDMPDKKIRWRPRLRNGNDPEFAFTEKLMQDHRGFNSWADAIIALAEYLKGKHAED